MVNTPGWAAPRSSAPSAWQCAVVVRIDEARVHGALRAKIDEHRAAVHEVHVDADFDRIAEVRPLVVRRLRAG